MKTYLYHHDHHKQNRLEFEAELVQEMKAMMTKCYSKMPEKFCLKLLFDSAFFWE